MHAHARARACARSHAHRAARRRRRAAPWKGAHIAGARRGAGGRLRSAADGPVSEGSRGFVSSSLFHCMQPRAGRPPPGAFASHQGHFPNILLHLQIPFRPHPFVHGRATQLAQARDCPPPLGHLQLACSNNKLACNQLSAACHQAAGVTAYPLSFPSSPQVSSHYTRTQRHPCSRGRTTYYLILHHSVCGRRIHPAPAGLAHRGNTAVRRFPGMQMQSPHDRARAVQKQTPHQLPAPHRAAPPRQLAAAPPALPA